MLTVGDTEPRGWLAQPARQTLVRVLGVSLAVPIVTALTVWALTWGIPLDDCWHPNTDADRDKYLAIAHPVFVLAEFVAFLYVPIVPFVRRRYSRPSGKDLMLYSGTAIGVTGIALALLSFAPGTVGDVPALIVGLIAFLSLAGVALLVGLLLLAALVVVALIVSGRWTVRMPRLSYRSTFALVVGAAVLLNSWVIFLLGVRADAICIT